MILNLSEQIVIVDHQRNPIPIMHSLRLIHVETHGFTATTFIVIASRQAHVQDDHVFAGGAE